MMFYRYLHDNGAAVTLEAIAKPNVPTENDMAVLTAGLHHEETVTASINGIYAAAGEAGDFRTMQFLGWFIKEQAEEETNAHNLISKMELFGSDAKGLYLFEQRACRTHLQGARGLGRMKGEKQRR